MKINNTTNFSSEQVSSQTNPSNKFLSLKNKLFIVLTALGITGYASGEILSSAPTQDNHTQYVTDIPAQDLSAANTTAFFPEKGKIDYNKDSLNQIIESRIVDIQKQRENEFLQEKFVALQKEVQEALNVFQNDNFFPKQKQESLSDQQLSLYWKNIEKANDLPSLAVACEKVVSYIDKLLNKKDIEVEGKTLKTKNIKNSDFFLKLDDQKKIFKDFVSTIKNTRFEPETFKNVQASPEVLKHSSTIDSLKKAIATQQDSLNHMQDSLVILNKDLNDSTDKKIEIELALKSGKVDYTEYENTTINADTSSLSKKHTMEKIENEQKNHVSKLGTAILNQNKKIINLEEHQVPTLSDNIDDLYTAYGEELTLLIDAIRTQHTNIMTEKDKGISDQIGSFKQLITKIYTKIDSLKIQHQNILNSITTEKEKIHISDSSKIESLLAKFQIEESNLATVYSQTNTELINKNITLGNMLLENYNIYLDMLKKCKEPLTGYFTGLEKEIAVIEKNIVELQKKYDENRKNIQDLSKSDDTKDVNECQKKIQENLMYKKKMVDAEKEKSEKSTTKENIHKEIIEIDDVASYIENNKNLTMFGMKIYLAAKQIKSTEAQLGAAKETKKHYELLLGEKNKSLTGITTGLTGVNKQIQVVNSNTTADKDNYAALSKLMNQKDSLLLSKKAIEADILNITGKVETKNREINKLKTALTDLAAFGSDELKKRDGLIYNRDQSFSGGADASKYYKEELLRDPKDILDDVPSIANTIKGVK